MRRLAIAMTVLTAAMFLALPTAGKGKPDKPQPPNNPPITETCVWLDNGGQPGAEGVLDGWDGTNSYRCKFTANPAASYSFTIEAATPATASMVLHPYVAVTDQYPSGGSICYREMVTGKVYPDETGVFAQFVAAQLDSYEGIDGICGNTPDSDGGQTYALTVSVQKARGGPLQLSLHSN